jgi:hypothetical protein
MSVIEMLQQLQTRPPVAEINKGRLQPFRQLQFRLRVGIDFAVQADFLKFRRCPFHTYLLDVDSIST